MRPIWGRFRSLPRSVVVIGAISFLNDASSEILYPLLPAFLGTVLGASPSVIGLIEGSAESVSSILKLFAGHVSDRFGRRKDLVVAGYGLAAFARTLLAFSATWPQAFALRISDRFGKGVRGAPRDAMIADAVAPEDRGLAFGFHRAMDHAGAVVGPLIALALVYSIAAVPDSPTGPEFKLIFLVAAIPGMLSVLVAAFALKDTRKGEVHRGTGLNLRASIAGFDGNFAWFMGVLALFTLSNSSDAFLLLRAKACGIPTAMLPALWAALHVSKVVSSLLGGHMSDRLGRKRLIVSGWLLYAAVYAGFGLAVSAVEIWALFLVYGIYFGLAEGAEKALVADLVRPDQRGTAYGLYNLAFGVMVLPASELMGAIWEWRGQTAAFLVSACISVVAALLLIPVRPRPRDAALTEAKAA